MEEILMKDNAKQNSIIFNIINFEKNFINLTIENLKHIYDNLMWTNILNMEMKLKIVDRIIELKQK